MENTQKTEQINTVVTDWIRSISEKGEVTKIESELVKEFLVGIGAKPEISEEAKESLGKYSNFKKRKGLNEVWGKGIVDLYKNWLKEEFIPASEKEYGLNFPTLYDPETGEYDDRETNNTNFSGSMQFLEN